MSTRYAPWLAVCLLFVGNSSLSAEQGEQGSAAAINERRAKFHYQMLCQGCHTEDGRGFNSVPRLQGYVGHFLNSEEGRSYLVRVPGSANADLDDDGLAELLNWMVLEFAQGSEPVEWQPYTESEVANYRKAPLLEVIEYRRQLVQQIETLSTGGSRHVQ